MMENMRVLTVTNFGETEDANERVTLSPMEIQMTSAKEEIRQNRPVQRMLVMFKDGAVAEVYVSEFDLLQVEQAIGMYGFVEG